MPECKSSSKSAESVPDTDPLLDLASPSSKYFHKSTYRRGSPTTRSWQDASARRPCRISWLGFRQRLPRTRPHGSAAAAFNMEVSLARRCRRLRSAPLPPPARDDCRGGVTAMPTAYTAAAGSRLSFCLPAAYFLCLCTIFDCIIIVICA